MGVFFFVSLAAVAANKAVSKTLNFIFNLLGWDHVDGGSSLLSPRWRCVLLSCSLQFHTKRFSLNSTTWLHTWLILKRLRGRNSGRFPDEKPRQNSTNCIIWKALSVPITFHVCVCGKCYRSPLPMSPSPPPAPAHFFKPTYNQVWQSTSIWH